MPRKRSESVRQEYLREMGIQPWYPRFKLPHAAIVREAMSVREPVDAPILAAEVPVLEDRIEPKAPHFAFAYLAIDERLAVICEIPYQSRGRLQSPVRALLARILTALSVEVNAGSTPVVHFQWPLLESDDLDKGLASARQTLQGFLARQLSQRPVRYLLVFSEQWPEYLFSAAFVPALSFPAQDTPAQNTPAQGAPAQDTPAQGPPVHGLFNHPDFPVAMLVTRGLYAMLEDEAIKKPAWSDLQVLKEALECNWQGSSDASAQVDE